MRVVIKSLCVLFLASVPLRADVEHIDKFVAICALFPNGQYEGDGTTYQLPEIYYIEIPMAIPGEDPTGTFGNVVHYSGAHGRVHSCGDRYDYTVVNVAVNWHVIEDQNSNPLRHQFTQLDNKNFWDWYYRDYDSPGQCDYSQNCHGFAFQVGDWPDNAAGIMGYRDPNQFIPAGAPPHTPCYAECSKQYAEIATNVAVHTVQVIGAECDPGVACDATSQGGGGGNNGEPCLIEVITFSAEQFRESGTYTRMEPCPGSLAVEYAHDRAGETLAAFGSFDNYKYYKRN